MAASLRAITYNIRKGKGASGRSRDGVGKLAQALAGQHLDLLLCQEVFHGPSLGSQSHELEGALGLAAYYRANKHRRVGHHGNATFTHLPVEHVERYDLTTNRIERRGVLYVRVDIKGAPLHIFNVHLGLNHRQRVKQLLRISTFLRAAVPDGEAVLLAGDFNDWRQRLDDVIVSELGFQNPFANRRRRDNFTWHARRPVFNLDRFYLRHATARHAERLFGDPWNELSDHLPLAVDIELH